MILDYLSIYITATDFDLDSLNVLMNYSVGSKKAQSIEDCFSSGSETELPPEKSFLGSARNRLPSLEFGC